MDHPRPDVWRYENGTIYSQEGQIIARGVERENAALVESAPLLLFALKTVLNSTFLKENNHDWRICDNGSCVIAKEALECAEGSL